LGFGDSKQRSTAFPRSASFAEIEWIARNKVGNVFTCDANFGILSRDVEIASYVARMKTQYGFPEFSKPDRQKRLGARD
jgi:hypothetical protein